ncbi:gastric triacylglycerol lipase-like [Linepithema humile]|uniref:gastric triacylglycerol lipase-like n=1 Tax=Linepithema humile TaxID=83485 RepID=UPI00351F6A6C
MRPTATALFLSFCGLLSVESSETSDISENSSLINIAQINIKLNNAKCDPDANLNTLQMIKKAGYPAEAHIVLTEDGYLLTLHRIPGRKNSPSVLLQHGLLSSSIDWIVSGRDKALGFILADQGYDVWLGNSRGNTYSRAHIFLSPSDSKFWDFSFDEMGIYDLPATILHIMSVTSQPLHTYVGYSMSTTSFYVMAIKRPEIAKMVKVMISLAPVAFTGNMTSPLRFFAPITSSIAMITRFFGADEFIPQNSVIWHILARYGCNIDLFRKEICGNIIFTIAGFDKEQFNYTLLPLILAHYPSGTSTRTLLHFSQEIKSGKFCAYDFGENKNLRIYNAKLPPDYNLSSITVPIALIYADNDQLATKKDINRLRGLLTNIVDDYRVPHPKFNHIDFLWAKDAPTLVYNKIIEIMKRKVN